MKVINTYIVEVNGWTSLLFQTEEDKWYLQKTDDTDMGSFSQIMIMEVEEDSAKKWIENSHK